MSMTYADLAASADARAWANQAATNAYQQSIMAGNSASQALQSAQFALNQKLAEAGQTGMWNGQYNMPSNQYFANTFGSWMPGGPQAGQQTLAAIGQQANIAQDWSSMFGQYYAPGTAPTQGQQTQAAQQAALANAATVAGLTGTYSAPGGTGSGTQTLAGQQQQWSQGFQQQAFQAQQAQLAQQNAQGYLGILANLRGPADWAKYQQVLGSTPNGMRDLYAAAMGQYTPGGGATTGQQPQAVSLDTMQQQIGGYGYGQPQQSVYQQYGQQPQGGNAQTMQYAGGPGGGYDQARAQWQQQAGQQGAQQAWGSGIGIGGQGATPQQQVQATGNGTNMYGGQQQQYNLPAPNQISSQAWNNFTPSQQQLMLGNYEAAGWDKGDVQSLYNQSLPKYGTNNASAGTWRLK